MASTFARRSIGRFFVLVSGLGAMVLAGCRPATPETSGDTSTPQSAQLILAVTNVPSDVSCIEVTVTGAATSSQLFDVTSGGSSNITVGGLPSGAVTVNEMAFAVPCAQVTTGTLATWVAQQPVMTTLTPGQTTAISIVLRRAGQLSISNDFEDGASGLAIAPSSQSFGNVVVGAVGSASFALANNGTTGIAFTTALSGSNATAFSVVAGSSCAALGTLAPGAACTFSVQFVPTALGAMSATLAVSAPGGVTVALTGTGVAAAAVVAIAPAAETFGNVVIGQTSGATFTVSNSGTAALTFSIAVTGTNATQFSLTGGSCAAVASLAAGASCTAVVQFAPTTTGALSAALTVAGGAASAPLSGTGVAAAAVVAIAPATESFGNVTLGRTATATLTVSNSGTASAPFSTAVTGPNAAAFTRTGG
jgi:hypothetical protein